MNRFKIEAKEGDYFRITGEELHHLANVLRLIPGDKVIGFDNSGRQFTGVIKSLTEEAAFCLITEEDYPQVEAGTRVYLVMGLAKGEKMEWVIQKGTELGMAGFIPLRTKRSVVRLEGSKARERVTRWQRIAAEAVKQSRRVVEPRIEDILSWQDLTAYFPQGTQWIMAYEDEKTSTLHKVLPSFSSDYPLVLLVGPEGGFEPEEAEWARNNLQASSVSLGPRILRTETAALAFLTMVLSYFGDLG
jgi:16S rRNA (uracil1498-N3)-methyltransferase